MARCQLGATVTGAFHSAQNTASSAGKGRSLNSVRGVGLLAWTMGNIWKVFESAEGWLH